MFNKSENIEKLAAALAKAQGEMKGAKKDSVNAAFGNSKYANLEQCWDACREVLSRNGLSIAQGIGPINDGRQEVTTMLMHTSGQWLESTGEYIIAKSTAHGQGSATTYARRYGLSAMIGLVQEDDDDGNDASGYDRNGNYVGEPKAKEKNPKKPVKKTKEELKSGFGVHDPELGPCINLDGKLYPLDSFDESHLQTVLDTPEWCAVHPEAQNLLNVIRKLKESRE